MWLVTLHGWQRKMDAWGGQLGVLLQLPTGAEGVSWVDTDPHHADAGLAALCGCLFDVFLPASAVQALAADQSCCQAPDGLMPTTCKRVCSLDLRRALISLLMIGWE